MVSSTTHTPDTAFGIAPAPAAPSLPRRLYVPLATAILVLVVGNFWAIHSHFDPQKAAQEERLHFKTAASTMAQGNGLTSAEVSLAQQIFEKPQTISVNRPTLLYLGDSQTLAIMDGSESDLLSAQWLQVLLARKTHAEAMDVRLASQPNLSPAEALVIIVATAEQAPGTVDAVLLSQALQEFRTVSIREDLMPLLTPSVRATLKALAARCADLPAAVAAIDEVDKPRVTVDAASDAAPPLAMRLDHRVNRLADAMPLFAKRQDLHAELKVLLYQIRNKAFRISSSSARPIPEPFYQANLQLIEMTLRYAKSKNIPVVAYLAPIRPITPNPNKKSDVVKYRRDVPALYQKYNAHVFDHSDLIAAALWTNHDDTHDARRDFDHFAGAGHKLLGETLFEDIGAQMVAIASQRANQATVPHAP
jgi:hypothetical protein